VRPQRHQALLGGPSTSPLDGTMSTPAPVEPCPLCGSTSNTRPKLLLIDEAWVPAPGKDPRLKYCADLRADDVLPQYLHQAPLQQFVDGYYCDRCGKGFVAEQILKADRRRYR
jgi:hypothetical protein